MQAFGTADNAIALYLVGGLLAFVLLARVIGGIMLERRTRTFIAYANELARKDKRGGDAQ